MTEEIAVEVRSANNVMIIDLVGDLTTFADEAVNGAYGTVTDQGAKNIILNFRQNDYINSAGIAILISVVTEARHRDQSILMTGLSQHFQKIFRMVGLTQYADIYPTLDDALTHLNSGLAPDGASP
jgi:anti-anti-sigma factor